MHTIIPDNLSQDLPDTISNSQLLSSANLNPKDQLNTLLFFPRIDSHKVPSASGLLVSYIYDTAEDELAFDRAVAALTNSSSSLQSQAYTVSATPNAGRRPLFSWQFSFLPFVPAPLKVVAFAYSLLMLYVAVSWEHIKSVRSKLGLLIAFVVQASLSLGSSLTIVSFFSPSFSPESMRHFLLAPFFVMIVGIENVLRLVNAVSVTPPENHPSTRLSAAINCLDKSLALVAIDCAVVLIPCLPFLKFPNQVKQLSCFTCLCLVIDLLMHVTYFTAILSVDLRRLELEDLITTDSPTNNNPYKFLGGSFSRTLESHYLHLKYWLFHPRISASAIVLTLSLTSLLIWNQTPHATNETSKRVAFFLSPLLSSHTFSNFNTIRIFEPVTIEAELASSTSLISFHLGQSIQGSFYKFSRIISVSILLELVASIAFILSLTGVILKFLLLPVTEPTESSSSSETAQFSSKELTGYHTLDVLQVITHGSMITTVSLDHKVFVWNASSAPGTKIAPPVQVPNPPDFWPITKVVLNSSLNLIAIFSTRIPAIKCYNFKTGVLLYHLQDRALFSTQPVETFFSGSELIVVGKSGKLLSISETGAMTSFTIEFSTQGALLSHAKRLVTPKIPERVVCLSKSNDISIGTHIGKVWKFRKLQIQESPVQINMHAQGVHDLSKYKPQPIPAPQAMLARSTMRGGKLGQFNALARPPINVPKILSEPIVALVPVPALNMVLIASAVHACLFDVQTGIIVRHFQIGHFKPHTLRVFHSHPTHCRFCGCGSVDTLSIAYTDLEEEGMVICHTLTIDNRAKNSICIRVERDPRETRCLGFEATTERQHWIGRVEGWDTTDMNMIMGVRRRETPQTIPTNNLNSPLSTSISWIKNQTQGLQANSGSQSRRRHTHTSSSKVSQKDSDFPLISSTWEGWAMSATGQVSFYDIPDYSEHLHPNESNRLKSPGGGPGGQYQVSSIGMELDSVSRSRLLIRSIGPVTKYGAKSIAVAFGNIIKVLYFGKEESLPKTEPESTGILPPPSPSPSVSGSRKWRREVGY